MNEEVSNSVFEKRQNKKIRQEDLANKCGCF